LTDGKRESGVEAPGTSLSFGSIVKARAKKIELTIENEILFL
jgi:hypothetical protein